mmetsp:Transcript_17953/g.32532  ORF Transcript_17953/g.32532 Transcript_17953/m.32532 type:complete len:104 (-) Transcript_17953:237-548(-)
MISSRREKYWKNQFIIFPRTSSQPIVRRAIARVLRRKGKCLGSIIVTVDPNPKSLFIFRVIGYDTSEISKINAIDIFGKCTSGAAISHLESYIAHKAQGAVSF